MSDLRHLNPDDFRRWMKKNEVEDAADQPIGARVESKFCGKKIARSMTLESGRAGRVVREFVQNGGTVKAVEGDECLIEVESGSFYTKKKNLIF